MSKAGCLRPLIIRRRRNLGFRDRLQRLLADGWSVAGGARSADTLEKLRAGRRGTRSEGGRDRSGVSSAGAGASDGPIANGRVDLVVNAASPYGRQPFRGPFRRGGEARRGRTKKDFEQWAALPARGAFAFLSASARFLREQGTPATVVQVTGGSSLRARPGRGLWAAGAFSVRALTQAAALELRETTAFTSALLSLTRS